MYHSVMKQFILYIVIDGRGIMIIARERRVPAETGAVREDGVEKRLTRPTVGLLPYRSCRVCTTNRAHHRYHLVDVIHVNVRYS